MTKLRRPVVVVEAIDGKIEQKLKLNFCWVRSACELPVHGKRATLLENLVYLARLFISII